MKQLFKNKLSCAAFIVAAIYLAEYFALGAPVFSRMWNTSPAIPITGAIIAVAAPAAVILNYFIFKNKTAYICVLCIAPALMAGHFLVFAFILSKLNYFLICAFPFLITAVLLLIPVFFIFWFPKLGKTAKRVCAVTLSALIFITCAVCLFGITPFYLSSGAAVFAVDGEYQIAFSTSHSSVASVTVNGKTYFDEQNGEKNACRLHRITVPTEELDYAKEYTINTRSVIFGYAYLPSKGRTINKQYSFRPVDETDGLQIYNLSDTHECIAGPARAAGWFGDKLDILILNGDIINDVSSEYQISLIYKLANKVTGGTRPVIFTRGNHECNGKLASKLGDYVGCAERGFYYTFRTQTAAFLVLDTCNDMADANALISPLAAYDGYRKTQSDWIKGLGEWGAGAQYPVVIAHMAYPLSGYISESCVWSGWARELTELTSGKAKLALCGHSHKTIYEQAGTADNAVADYPVLRGSIRSDKYADREGISAYEFTGAALEFKDGVIDIKFTNTKKQVLGEHSLKV